MHDHASSIADSTAIGSLFAWILAHITQINEVMQLLVLLVGFLSGCVSIAYHVKRYRHRHP